MSSRREVLLLISGSRGARVVKSAGDTDKSLGKALGEICWLSQFQAEDGSINLPECTRIPKEGVGVVFFSRDGETEYSPDTVLGDIPIPPVLIALLPQDEEEQSIPQSVRAQVLAMQLANHKEAQKFIDQHSATSTGPTGKSITKSYDVFLSYASSDSSLAHELRDELVAEGVSCFMAAKDLQVGQVWVDAIRDALRQSRHMLLLVTPNSVKRPWILLEAGAAWVLDTPIIPALAHVSPRQLVEPISRFQARNIETTQGRRELIREIKRT